MELIFLIALLGVVVWLNRGMFGFGGPEWISADAVDEHGGRKWLCSQCGRQETTADATPPPACSCKNA